MKISNAAGTFAIGLLGGLLGAALLPLLGVAPDASNEVHEELTAKRINIVEEGGNSAMVLANSEQLPASTINGQSAGTRNGVPGIIFYNNLGDEIGGLIYPARSTDYGYDGGVQLSMDQIKQTGQAVALRHWRSGTYVRSMLEITDYSTENFAGNADQDPDIKPVVDRMDNASSDEEVDQIYFGEYLPLLGEKGYLAHRIFLGSEGAESRRAMLEIKDSRSRPRIRLIVDEEDQARIEVLDAEGNVTSTL